MQSTKSVDKRLLFEERKVDGELARMLMNHADIGSYEDLSSTNREAVKGILEICQGLPLAFGIAGATARSYCEDSAVKQNAWSEYYHDLKVDEECIASGRTRLYGSVWRVVDRSLKVLDSGSGIKRQFGEASEATKRQRSNAAEAVELGKFAPHLTCG